MYGSASSSVYTHGKFFSPFKEQVQRTEKKKEEFMLFPSQSSFS
jgi:hypothetical protein